jgi:hypothetical protein
MRFAAQTPRYLPTSRAPGLVGVESSSSATPSLRWRTRRSASTIPKIIGSTGVNQPRASTIHTFGLVSYRQRCRPVLSLPSTANRAYSANGDAVAIQMAGLRSSSHPAEVVAAPAMGRVSRLALSLPKGADQTHQNPDRARRRRS